MTEAPAHGMIPIGMRAHLTTRETLSMIPQLTTDELRHRIRGALEQEANHEGTVIYNDDDDLDAIVERVLSSIKQPLFGRAGVVAKHMR